MFSCFASRDDGKRFDIKLAILSDLRSSQTALERVKVGRGLEDL
jgi:hypothetical protein